ncbi:flavin reductase family protein [Candidatus Bathyarchaeota archaeon]|nr:flavin reductase family protein [Candidatus Bathyarchaeota archaeon]
METKKVKVPLSDAYKFLHPMHTVLVTCIGKAGKANIITLAWVMPASINPPLVAISVKPTRHSHGLVREAREFVVNIPTMKIVQETLFCGRRSGENCDKFKETKLTPLQAKTVEPPIIEECIAHLECKLEQTFTTGDHTIFVGRVVEAYVNEDSFKREFDIKKAKLIYHLGRNKFATLSHEVIKPSL